MFGFNGDFRQRPVQSMRGASKNEMKESLLKRAQEERRKREDQRLRIASAGKIQAYFRGFKTRKNLWGQLREKFDTLVKEKSSSLDAASLRWCISKLCLFYRNELDAQRLIFISQELIKKKDDYLNSCGKDSTPIMNQLRLILNLVIRYLDSIASSGAAIAIPMRMLEIFLSPNTYSTVLWSKTLNADKTVSYLLLNVVRNGYFDCLRNLLNCKIPSSLDKTVVPPTPVAESIFDLIMKPISFAVSLTHDVGFRQAMLREVTRTFLCQQYTEQVAMFLLPAMAYGKYPFPFVELVQTLIHGVSSSNGKQEQSDQSSPSQSVTEQNSTEGDTPWLLASVLTLANKTLDNMSAASCASYLKLLQRLLLQLPPSKHFSMALTDESDSEEDEEMDAETGVTDLQNLHSECLRMIDSRAHLKCLYTCLTQLPPGEFIESLASISHCLLAHQKMAMHKIRLLYVLAFNPQFMRNLWNKCVSSSVKSVTGSYTSLISMLANGVPMSKENISRIIPLLTTFCCLFDHSLLTLDDADFYGQIDASKSSMPFSLQEMIDMCSVLRDTCLGIIELAHPDSRVALGNDYVQALQLTSPVGSHKSVTDDHTFSTHQWAYLFKAVSTLVRQLHNRDSRRPFCPFNHWLASKVIIRTDRPAQIYESQNSIFRRRDFGSLASLTKANADMDGPPLANRDVRNLVILTELPFVISFLDRVKIMQTLLAVDKQEHQGDIAHFGLGPSININIRRNFIYEDAFEKLSYENEPNLKKKMRIKLLNAAGLDEAGIDGGGIFREFLSELLKTGFDPNRGIFRYTTDRLLYPNPESGILVDNFTTHYFFLGRILGKALMENLMVEIPFASFFLSKILSPSNISLDIHHLQSLDPLLYKNLLYLKHYDGDDVSDLGLDFSVVNNQFGETKVIELKPNGRNIPVTNVNRIEYIHLMADYRINKQIRQHCNAFRMGMNDVIQLEWLQMFNSGELQVLISGASIPIDLEDLRRNTKYSGEFSDVHPVIEMFWVVLNDFTDHQKRQLLKFVTSCSRPPLLGFRDLFPAFCIHSAGPDDRLPTASTCMNLLKLPVFKSEENLKTKLLYAIESEAGFELS